MDKEQDQAHGWLNALRRLGDSLLGLAQNRIELFALELREEKLRTLNLVVWLLAALALVAAGFFVVLGALAVFLWDIAGYWGLIGLALALLAAGVGVLWGVRHRIKNSPTPFAETIGEFKKDRACLRNND